MYISAITASAVAANVWTSATRTLTADPTPFTAVSAHGTATASTIIDLRPAAGKTRFCTLNTQIGATSTQPGLYDGTTFYQGAVITNGSNMVPAEGVNAMGPAVNSGTGAAGSYSIGGTDRG